MTDIKLLPIKEEPEFIKKMKEDIAKNPIFKQLQEIGEEYKKQAQKIALDLKPMLDQVNIAQQQFQNYKKDSLMTIKYVRPVEYDILDELRALNRKNSPRLKATKDSGIVITYNTTDNSLDRYVNGKLFSYDFSEDGKRKRLLDILINRSGYVKTKDLKQALNCPTTQAVAKLAQNLNDYANATLRLKGIKLVNGKGRSGYRLNPKIIIEKE